MINSTEIGHNPIAAFSALSLLQAGKEQSLDLCHCRAVVPTGIFYLCVSTPVGPPAVVSEVPLFATSPPPNYCVLNRAAQAATGPLPVFMQAGLNDSVPLGCTL